MLSQPQSDVRVYVLILNTAIEKKQVVKNTFFDKMKRMEEEKKEWKI